MSKMKELYTTGHELQRQMASGQLFVPTFEELREMQDRYLELLRISTPHPGVQPREDQTSIH